MLTNGRDPGKIESLVGLYGVMVRKIAVRLSRVGVHLVILNAILCMGTKCRINQQ